MKKIIPLPDDDKFFIELNLLNNVSQLSEWFDDSEQLSHGAFIPNSFEEHDYFNVGKLFLVKDSFEPIGLSGLSVECAIAYTTVITSFANFESLEAQALFTRESVVNSTKYIMSQLLDLIEETNVF